MAEILGLLLAGGVLGAGLRAFQDSGRLPPGSIWIGPAGFVAGLVAFVHFRWRSRLRLTPEGAFRLRSAGRVVTRIAWDEIDEVFLLGPSGFEVRGAGKRIRFGDAYENVAGARESCTGGLSDLRSRLVDRALKDGELVFRTPGSRWSAHAAYLAAVLLLTGVTGAVVMMFMKALRKGFPIFLIFFGTGWLWRLRGRASRRGTRVTLYPDGLLVRRLDGSDKVAWSEIQRTEWSDRGDLILVLHKGRKILLPSTLGNIAILEELVEERRAAGERP